MGKWRSYRYRCNNCKHSEDKILDLNTSSKEDVHMCSKCSEGQLFIVPFLEQNGFSTSKCSASVPDGMGRFKHIKEKRKLEREISKAKKSMDTDVLLGVSKEARDRNIVVKGGV